jgi:DNA-directed RNA polymerase specialized sigma24 family protein
VFKDNPRGSASSMSRADQAAQKCLDPKYQSLYKAVKAAYQPNSSNSLSLWASVQAELRRYKMEITNPASTILHESFLRGVKAIDQGKEIPSPSAWLRKTCHNVIKEKSRGKKRSTQLENIDLIPGKDKESEEPEDELCQKYQKVREALCQLSKVDQDILTLKIVEGRQWEAVQKKLILMGHRMYSVEALRQRKSRAFRQLKEYIESQQ